VTTAPPRIEPLIVPRATEIRAPLWPRVLIGLGALLLALILLAIFTARPDDPRLFPGPVGEVRTTVYLVDNGFHANLVVPREALFARPHPAALAAAMASDRPWLSIGWGDARFYTEEGLNLGRALSGLRALFLPGNRSVVLIAGLPGSPDRIYASGVRRVELTDIGLERALARVDNSLTLDSSGQPQRTEGPRQADQAFFRSGERFSLVHLCNHWIADLLNAAGLPTTPVLDTLPIGLEWDLSRAGVK
jgi:uncharacterized protein (TIGR02117 family)